MHRHHKNIRMAGDRYTGQHRYFITACCAERYTAFAAPGTAAWLIDVLGQKSVKSNFAVEAYCVMPDHLHILIRGLDDSADARSFMRLFKQQTAHDHKRKHHRELWQKKYYDHILREHDRAETVANYIWQNPVRKGICRDPREYPFSGSFSSDWKNLISASQFWEPPWKEQPAQ